MHHANANANARMDETIAEEDKEEYDSQIKRERNDTPGEGAFILFFFFTTFVLFNNFK
jgi:hypothetical protein